MGLVGIQSVQGTVYKEGATKLIVLNSRKNQNSGKEQ